MSALLGALLLVAHGLVHPAIYAIPPDPKKPAPFDPSRSWALAAHGVDVDAMRAASVAFAAVTAAAYGVAGALLLLGGPWSAPAVLGAVAGLTLKSLWFHPWLILGVAIDLAVLALVISGGVWP